MPDEEIKIPHFTDQRIPRHLHEALLGDEDDEPAEHCMCNVCMEFFPEEDVMTCSYCSELYCPGCASESVGNCQSCVEDFDD